MEEGARFCGDSVTRQTWKNVLWLCMKIAFLLEPVCGRLRLERGFEVVSERLRGLTFLVLVDSSFERFLSRNALDMAEL